MAVQRRRLAALRASWLFDGSGGPLQRDPVVVIDGGTIVSVGFGVAPPMDAEVVDLGETTILPGLIDTHVHLAFDASPDPVASLARRSDAEVVEAIRAAGRVALTGGVTTVRDLGDRDYLSLGLRAAPGMPTLLAAGPPLTTQAGHCHFLGGEVAPGVAGIVTAVQEHVERGVDVIKITASGGQMTAGTRQHEAHFSVEELRAAVEEAHRHGLRVTAHAHATQGIRNAVAAGVDGIEHASFWSEEGVDDPGDLVDLLAATGVVVGATAGLAPSPGALPPPEILKRMPAIFAIMRRMHQSGVRMVAGTDAGIAPPKPHDVVRYAVPALTDLGMSSAHALATITSLAADAIGLGDTKGRVAAGYDADLLVVEGDPVTDPTALHKIRAVYQAGTPISR